MMWPFKKKKSPELRVIKFKTGQDFFDYHCKFMMTRIEPGVPLAAIVIDARTQFGTSVAVKTHENGLQTATLRVASDDGGFLAIAETSSNKGDSLVPGDVVAWIPGQHMPQLAKASKDARSGWAGLIIAKIAPEIDMSRKAMTVICEY